MLAPTGVVPRAKKTTGEAGTAGLIWQADADSTRLLAYSSSVWPRLHAAEEGNVRAS